jgi:hypothetical protein
MAGFINISDIGQIATLIGIPSILITIFMQIRSYKKDQKETAEKNRLAITTEINTTTQTLFYKIENRLEAIKIAAIVSKEDITNLKQELIMLRQYVDDLDKSGTIEWKKTKPFIIEKIGGLEERIAEIENRFNYKMTEIAKSEIQKNKLHRHESN